MPSHGFLTKLLVAGVTILGTNVVAVLSAHLGRATAARDRRRQTYGEAYKTAVEWREMVYRVRRTADSEKDLVEKFHSLQERIAFHEGWIGSQSKCMRLSYRQLVRAARSETSTA